MHKALVLQAKIVSQIGEILSSFAQQKTQEVSRTVASLQSQLASGRHAIDGSFSELHNLSAATVGHTQVCESTTVTLLCHNMTQHMSRFRAWPGCTWLSNCHCCIIHCNLSIYKTSWNYVIADVHTQLLTGVETKHMPCTRRAPVTYCTNM